ncbi:serine protease [Pelagibacterium lentulum]|uniref:Peptidoglycan binding-like domain-containing protein n=1 Tax=Pelagibacterium lentulum TaxID=2029865 RepID=A0A916RCJ0_9HYPH|nr:serine protease [Pelagibacterium lentulum]GGA51762.1 hypothetical protein GCM10011499_22250 [Pelagibacterium lentulum]
MSEEDRGLLQSKLILVGQYSAIADSQFGPATYRALTNFQAVRGDQPSGVLSSTALIDLHERASFMFAEMGMEIVEDARGQMSMLLPTALLSQTENTRRGMAYFDPSNSIRLETISKPYADESYESLYRSLSTENARRQITYKTFNASRFVVTGYRQGFPFYIYMSAAPQSSIGFSIEWDSQYDEVGGMLAVFMASHSYPLLATSQSPEAVQTPQGFTPTVPRVSYGTGFFVAENGVLVSNHHVIENCSAIDVPGYGAASVILSDADLDLAVLRLDDPHSHAVATLRTRDIELGEAVVSVGYPLATYLNSSLSVGTGIVSGETGLRGEQRWFTTNVGIQYGNSGGPLLDEYGQVIGVAVAKSDELYLLSSIGTVAPNVGFAIKTGPLLDFLSIFRLPDTKPSKEAIPVRASVEIARDFTVQIVCSTHAN